MNKTELITAVADKTGISKKDADLAVNATFDVIAESLEKKDKVQLIGFGTFETRERAAREGVNPATGKKISIDACTVPAFKAGKALKETVNTPEKEAPVKKSTAKKKK